MHTILSNPSNDGFSPVIFIHIYFGSTHTTELSIAKVAYSITGTFIIQFATVIITYLSVNWDQVKKNPRSSRRFPPTFITSKYNVITIDSTMSSSHLNTTITNKGTSQQFHLLYPLNYNILLEIHCKPIVREQWLLKLCHDLELAHSLLISSSIVYGLAFNDKCILYSPSCKLSSNS